MQQCLSQTGQCISHRFPRSDPLQLRQISREIMIDFHPAYNLGTYYHTRTSYVVVRTVYSTLCDTNRKSSSLERAEYDPSR